MLALNISASAVGRKVIVEATLNNVREVALGILDATFAVKSPGTLLRRLYAVQSYEDWCSEKLQKHWLPVQEFDVWTYVRFLQTSKAPPTKSGSLVEALRFTWFLLGVEGADLAEQSLRVKGVSAQMRAAKRPWRPADLLTVKEVKMLHALLESGSEAMGAGHLLHLLYSRSRWSDLTMVSSIFMDAEACYLEVYTQSHKTARGAEQKSKLLPIVCSCTGIDGQNWAVTYFSVRQQCGLTLPLEGPGSMMRCPLNSAATSWSQRPLSSQEGSDFMRKVLDAPKSAERRISSHSLKSTLLSWTSKYGLSEHSRAVLARHTSKAVTATAVYSRDLLSPILRELNLVLEAVRNGSFNPDMTRSGMLTPGALPFLGGTPMPAATGGLPGTPVPDVKLRRAAQEQGEDRSSDGSFVWLKQSDDANRLFETSGARSPSGDSLALADDEFSETTEENSVQSSSESDLGDGAGQYRDFRDAPSDFVINNKSLVLHQVKSAGWLTCGRKLTPSYSKIFELNGIRCSRCFNV